MSAFEPPVPDLQVAFYGRLQELRDKYLLDALQRIVATCDIGRVDRELRGLVSKGALRKLARWSLRGEIVFPVPHILSKSPNLLGYYRLLLGFSQKQFYGSRYGFAPFRSMETEGRLSESNAKNLAGLCGALCRSAELLITGVGSLSTESVHELTLITLGPQLRGGALNALGARATLRVFNLIKSILSAAIDEASDHSIDVINAAGRRVSIEFANDPDICIREKMVSGRLRNIVAIEIKGGRDASNIHNRIGEAEKSHQKAKENGYVECWTIVGVSEFNVIMAKRESPTTDEFFRIDGISEPASDEYRNFREHLKSLVGIRD